jgi:hypothetical protein
VAWRYRNVCGAWQKKAFSGIIFRRQSGDIMKNIRYVSATA